MSSGDNHTSSIRDNMVEKLGYAKRSFDRMKESKDSRPVDVQDHFWSYLHAANLIWFYFGRWVNEQRIHGAKPKKLVEKWKKKTLNSEQVDVWNLIIDLRKRDAHVEPVPAKKQERNDILTDSMGRRIVNADGKQVTVKFESCLVRLNGKEIDIFEFCEQGIAILEMFVGDFESLT